MKVSGGLVPSEVSLSACRWAPPHCVLAPSLWASHPWSFHVSRFSLLIRIPISWIRAHCNDLILAELPLQIPYVQMQSHSESLVAKLVKNPPAMWETWVWSLGWEDPLKGKGYPFQDSGLKISMDCIVHGVAKSRTRLSDSHSANAPTGMARNHVYQLSGLPWAQTNRHNIRHHKD